MKYKYFTWIQDVLQELLCLSSIQKKKKKKELKAQGREEYMVLRNDLLGAENGIMR